MHFGSSPMDPPISAEQEADAEKAMAEDGDRRFWEAVTRRLLGEPVPEEVAAA